MDSSETAQKQAAPAPLLATTVVVQNHPPASSFPTVPIEIVPDDDDFQDLDGLPDLVDSSGSESDSPKFTDLDGLPDDN